MTGPEFFYLFEYIREIHLYSNTIKTKLKSLSYLVSEGLEWQISQNSENLEFTRLELQSMFYAEHEFRILYEYYNSAFNFRRTFSL